MVLSALPPKADKRVDVSLSPLCADFVAEVADESRKLRRRSAGAVAYHSLRWKRWLEATALAPSTRLQRDLTLIPRMGRPAVAAGRRAWPACGQRHEPPRKCYAGSCGKVSLDSIAP